MISNSVNTLEYTKAAFPLTSLKTINHTVYLHLGSPVARGRPVLTFGASSTEIILKTRIARDGARHLRDPE